MNGLTERDTQPEDVTMYRMVVGILVLLFGLSVAAGDERRDKPATPAEQYKAILKEFNEAAHSLHKATTDEERKKAAERVDPLSGRLLELAEKNAKDPIALDALVQILTQELWLENNTSHPGRGKDSPQVKALAQLLRDHVKSDKIGPATWRAQYGFRKECETFLRTVLEKNPHKEIQGLTCLRLAQFLSARSQRLELLKEQPDVARRYEGLFGKDYLTALRRQDRAKAAKEVEDLFERAADKYGDVKLPYGGTVGERAKSELYEIRHLCVGKEAPEARGVDQDGKQFALGDYRGKVVLLYFWSEY
jgi:hypothetical protein